MKCPLCNKKMWFFQKLEIAEEKTSKGYVFPVHNKCVKEIN